MGEIILYISLTIFLPIALLLIFLEKRARRVMLSFLCGVLVCFSAYFINTSVYRSGSLSSSNYSLIFSPLVEELLKFIPLFLFSICLKKGKRQTIAMSFALGVGFCVVENFYYLFSNAHNVNVAWVIARCIGTGLMHSMSATLIGYGLYLARINSKKSFLIGALTMVVATLYHGLYNSLVATSSTQIIGIFVPIISYIGLSLFLKKDAIKAFFDDEEGE